MTAVHQIQLETLPENIDINDSFRHNSYDSTRDMSLSYYKKNSVSSSGTDIESNLLEDLWSVPSNTDNLSNESFSSTYSPLQKCYSKSPTSSRSPNLHSTVPLEASFFLPNNLMNVLPPLTKENLNLNDSIFFEAPPDGKRNRSLSGNSDEAFRFESLVVPPTKPVDVTGDAALRHNCGHSKKQSNINTQLYKTELCASFLQSGACPYGVKCQFAHGADELKQVHRPSNWRSKPCANWTKYGSCRYGHRCCFKHE